METRINKFFVVSDLHGSLKAYEYAKGIAKNSPLYILGDIFDGNNSRPEECLEILEKIKNDNNVFLLLGNHEYAHIAYWNNVFNGDEEAANAWEGYLCDPICQGGPLLSLLKKKSEEDVASIVKYLSFCPAIHSVQMGQMHFVMVHGSPHPSVWDSLSCQLDECALENALSFLRSTGVSTTEDRVRVITGHIPTKYIVPPTEDKYERMALFGNCYDIDCGCRANTLGKLIKGWKSNVGVLEIGSYDGYSVYFKDHYMFA